MVLGAKSQRDQTRRRPGHPGQPIESTLDLVDEVRQSLEAQAAPRALQGMHGTQSGGQRRLALGIIVEIQQRLFQLRQKLNRLLAKSFGGIVPHHPITFLTTASR